MIYMYIFPEKSSKQNLFQQFVIALVSLILYLHTHTRVLSTRFFPQILILSWSAQRVAVLFSKSGVEIKFALIADIYLDA